MCLQMQKGELKVLYFRALIFSFFFFFGRMSLDSRPVQKRRRGIIFSLTPRAGKMFDAPSNHSNVLMILQGENICCRNPKNSIMRGKVMTIHQTVSLRQRPGFYFLSSRDESAENNEYCMSQECFSPNLCLHCQKTAVKMARHRDYREFTSRTLQWSALSLLRVPATFSSSLSIQHPFRLDRTGSEKVGSDLNMQPH